MISENTIWFFGTFNPVHCGHVQVATAALEGFPAFDSVTFVPTGEPPHKSSPEDFGSLQLAAAKDRLEMVRLAVKDNPAFTVSEAELQTDGPSYTCETLKRLGLFGLSEPPALVVGVDAFNTLSSWHRAEELLEGVHFLVAPREGLSPKTLFQIGGETYEPMFSMIPMAETPVSSSQVRRHLQEGRELGGLLPDAVARYIARHGLYGASVVLR